MILNVHAGHNAPEKAGHGAVGIIDESQEAREVKNRVIAQLRGAGHTVYDCTEDNGSGQVDVLNKIVAKCNSHDVDLDVSIHFNAGGGQGGTECWVHPTPGIAHTYADRICNSISGLGYRNRGIKPTTDLFVLNKTKAPAVLIECCFCDVESDCDRYNPDSMASAIASAINGGDVPTPQPTPTDDIICEGVCNTDGLNVRSGAGTNHEVLFRLNYGNNVNVLEFLPNGWLKVTCLHGTGYCAAEFVNLPELAVGTCNASLLNVRSGVGTNYDVVFKVARGNKVSILANVNGWHYISCTHGRGYCAGEYID